MFFGGGGGFVGEAHETFKKNRAMLRNAVTAFRKRDYTTYRADETVVNDLDVVSHDRLTVISRELAVKKRREKIMKRLIFVLTVGVFFLLMYFLSNGI